MKREDKSTTNWTKYYEAPKSRFSTITQKITLKRLLQLIKMYIPNETRFNIIELGGGNSCFAKGMLAKINGREKNYSIVDNNELGIEKAKKQGVPIKCYYCDILNDKYMCQISNDHNIVYSVGLIEHFCEENIIKIIEAHFKLVNEEGLVIITFPTPTVQYRIIRKCMEWLGVWQFWDEKPLKWQDVKTIFEKNGTVLYHKTNYKLPLTQMIVVAKKKKNK